MSKLISSALILIDLQNDFLAPSAPFAVDLGSQESFRITLERLVPLFRDSGGHIIWVRSYYSSITPEARAKLPEPSVSTTPNEDTPPHLSTNNERAGISEHLRWLIQGTHIGSKPCCREGTAGAEFVAWAVPLMDVDRDTIVTKTNYSAFKDSLLAEILREKSVKSIYLGGLLTNMCVLATTLDALQLAKVVVVEDALAWRKYESHQKALQTMAGNGARLLSSHTLFQ
ncbi:Isochorismatase hydrolase [Serendipita vermifera]|nr:Isochorismatase hydrolase [Serendipita vermifera]